MREETIDIVVRGESIVLSRSDVLRAVVQGGFGPVRRHAVEVEGQLYPVKEVFARAAKLEVLDFNTVHARSALGRLGFELRRVDVLGHRRSAD